jgi:hypothetical protein
MTTGSPIPARASAKNPRGWTSHSFLPSKVCSDYLNRIYSCTGQISMMGYPMKDSSLAYEKQIQVLTWMIFRMDA